MFSGIKYILGYADESPNSLKPNVDGANANEGASATSANHDLNKDCGVSMIEDGLDNPPILAEQNQSCNQQLTDDWSCDSSIDMVDMDESWYVIPPPCFTGGEKSEQASDELDRASEVCEQPKTKEAARENALIEHPSFYIASSSKQLAQHNETAEKPSDPPLDLAKRIVLKKAAKKTVRLDIVPKVVVNALEDAAWVSEDEDALNDGEQPKRTSTVAKPNQETLTGEAKSSAANERPVAIKKIEEPMFKLSSCKKKRTNKRPSSSHSAIKVKPAAVFTNVKPTEKAWKNKFIVDDWDLDDQEDVDSDFDSMFEPVRKKKSPSKTKRQQKQQPNQLKKIQEAESVVVDEYIMPDVSAKLDPEDISPSGTLANAIEQCDDTSDSVELISMRALPMENSLIAVVTENEILESGSNLVQENNEANDENMKLEKKEENRKRPVQVRPIEPERRPGWQLKRQRSKRRPLGGSTVTSKQLAPNCKTSKSASAKNDFATNSSSSSSRSTPTLIDRIGNSIVSNLTNLTNGLVSSGALNSCSPVNHSPLMEGTERMRQTGVNKSIENAVCNMIVRKHLSKGFLNRQNICAQQSNRQRHPDRRLKMFTTPNGCSINRKVHTSIH